MAADWADRLAALAASALAAGAGGVALLDVSKPDLAWASIGASLGLVMTRSMPRLQAGAVFVAASPIGALVAKVLWPAAAPGVMAPRALVACVVASLVPTLYDVLRQVLEQHGADLIGRGLDKLTGGGGQK